MKGLKNLSVYKPILLAILCIHVNNIFLLITCLLFLFFTDKKNLIIFIILYAFIYVSNTYKNDFISYGIIESRKNNYYIIDKLFYKVKLYTNDKLEIGSIIKANKYNLSDNFNDLKKNILYYGFNYKYIYLLDIKNIIYEKINLSSSSISTCLNKVFYNITNYDDLNFNLGYGFTFYYIFLKLSKKYKILTIIFIFVYSLLFSFQIKFLLILIDIFISMIDTSNLNKISIKILILQIINDNLFYNYAILISLIIELYRIIQIKLNFTVFIAILQSILFGYINILSLLLYKIFQYIQYLLAILSILVIIEPNFTSIYLKYTNLISSIYNIQINVRGSISILSIILFLLIYKTVDIKRNYINIFVILFLILSPINDPFMSISFIDVGQGDAILIKYPLHKGCILIDTGSKYNYYKLNKYLSSKGIYVIDYLIITHDDEDHNGNIENLKNDYYIKNIITNQTDVVFNKTTLKNYKFEQQDNDNDNSLIYSLNINNLDFLFTGDISSNIEKRLINEYGPIDVDVLKVSHHGSNTGTSNYFLSNTLPSYAIISTSGLYNHPSPEVIENLNSYLIKYFITKQDGDIVFYLLPFVNLIKTGIFNFVIIMS